MDLTPEDIDALIRDATWRCGGASGAALRAEAIRVLRAHADVAYPVVLERARTQPTRSCSPCWARWNRDRRRSPSSTDGRTPGQPPRENEERRAADFLSGRRLR